MLEDRRQRVDTCSVRWILGRGRTVFQRRHKFLQLSELAFVHVGSLGGLEGFLQSGDLAGRQSLRTGQLVQVRRRRAGLGGPFELWTVLPAEVRHWRWPAASR